MQLVIDRARRTIAIIAVAVIAVVVIAVALWYAPPAGANHPCSGVDIKPGNDLDAIVNNDPATRATTFCVHASSTGTTYTINDTVQLRSGDKLLGQPGQVITRGPASYGVPLVKIRNGASLGKLIQLSGSNVELRWLDVAGAKGRYIRPFPNNCSNPSEDGSRCPKNGTGVAIGAGKANGTLLMTHLRVHHNEAVGVGSISGKLLHSNLHHNGTNPVFWGYSAAAVKSIKEYNAAYNYVHDNPSMGLWCDHACANVSSRGNGFWVHHNLLVNNDHYGVRYEYSPRVASGTHASQPTALTENNRIHANGYGGTSMQDAQNGVFRYNTFGQATIDGVFYPHNGAGPEAMQFSEGKKTTNLYNAKAYGNTLGGEYIQGCSKPDAVVYCANNR